MKDLKKRGLLEDALVVRRRREAGDIIRRNPIDHEAMTDKISVHDLHATMMHLMGFDHEKLTYPAQGVPQRLTNITKPGSRIVKGVLA